MGDTWKSEKANPYAGYVDVLPAKRLANTIGTVKVVLMVLAALGPVALLFASPELAVLAILYGLVAVGIIYVTFGWLEHTLRLLVGIAYNTAESADLMAVVDEDEPDVR